MQVITIPHFDSDGVTLQPTVGYDKVTRHEQKGK